MLGEAAAAIEDERVSSYGHHLFGVNSPARRDSDGGLTRSSAAAGLCVHMIENESLTEACTRLGSWSTGLGTQCKSEESGSLSI